MTRDRLRRVPELRLLELRRRVLRVHRQAHPLHHRARRVNREVANPVGITTTAAGAVTAAGAEMTRAAVRIGAATATGARTAGIVQLIIPASATAPIIRIATAIQIVAAASTKIEKAIAQSCAILKLTEIAAAALTKIEKAIAQSCAIPKLTAIAIATEIVIVTGTATRIVTTTRIVTGTGVAIGNDSKSTTTHAFTRLKSMATTVTVVVLTRMAIATACLLALVTDAAGKATIPGVRTSSRTERTGTTWRLALVMSTSKPIATDSSEAIRRDMRTGRDILAAGVFTPSRSSNFWVEQRRSQVRRGVAIYAKPSNQEPNQTFRATISDG